jgi:hypothetical protein
MLLPHHQPHRQFGQVIIAVPSITKLVHSPRGVMKVKVIVEVAMDIGHLIIQVNNVTHYILSVTVILIAVVQQIVLGMGINNVNLETLLQLLLLLILQLFFLPSLRLFQKDVTQSTTRIASPRITYRVMNRAMFGYLLVLKTIA